MPFFFHFFGVYVFLELIDVCFGHEYVVSVVIQRLETLVFKRILLLEVTEEHRLIFTFDSGTGVV